jgi:hypothetical protein
MKKVPSKPAEINKIGIQLVPHRGRWAWAQLLYSRLTSTVVTTHGPVEGLSPRGGDRARLQRISIPPA